MRAPPDESRVIRSGVFEVNLREEEIRRSGLRQKLGPQPFQVLQAMLERPGQLVTREELRQRLWPDNTFVDYELALKKCINRIREVLGDSAENPRFIETLPRRGYRFIAPIQIVSPHESTALPLAASDQQTLVVQEVKTVGSVRLAAPRRNDRTIAAVGVLMLAAAVGIAAYFVRQRRSAPGGVVVPIEALAVLPLENLSADKDSDYYAEGMTDELITQLAKISGVRVISRTSVMPFEGKRKPLQEIARALNVDAVVEGTVLRSGGRVRITAQLIQVTPERHLWAESYEREERDVLDLQAELAENVAQKISVSIRPGEPTTIPINVEAHEA